MRKINVLLVEDNPGDVRLTQEAFKMGNIEGGLFVVSDGIEAMAFLRREGEYAKAVRPDMVLLDLNLPRKDGREVLADMKADKELKLIPVIILTTSSALSDIFYSYDNHANSFISKPVELSEFVSLISACCKYWLKTVKLPSMIGS